MSSTTSYPPRFQGDSRSGNSVREHRAAATTAGILYIIGTVAGILSKVVTYFPVHNADDPLAYAADHSGAVATGALLVLVMGLSLAMVPVVLFPMLRRVDEVLATGYLIIRGAVEATTYVIVATAWLLLVPLADTMSAGPGTASPAGVRLGTLVIDSDGASAIMSLVFCLGGALFYVLLYRSRIVPRWIASWGLIGDPALRCRLPARDVRSRRHQLLRGEPARPAPGRAGDGAGGLDDRARLPSGGRLEHALTRERHTRLRKAGSGVAREVPLLDVLLRPPQRPVTTAHILISARSVRLPRRGLVLSACCS